MASSQVATLLKELLSLGIEAQAALPVIKALLEAKIMSLSDISSETELPHSIPKIIRRKLRKSPPKKQRKLPPAKIEIPPVSQEPAGEIIINRAPVLTIWATVVAESLFSLSLEECLSFGSAVASHVSKGKGESLGIYEKGTDVDPLPSADRYTLLDQIIHAKKSSAGIIIALDASGKAIDYHRTWHLLQKRFGDSLPYVIREMRSCAKQAGDSLSTTAYRCYMSFRPVIPKGTKGWGAHGALRLGELKSFYDSKPSAS